MPGTRSRRRESRVQIKCTAPSASAQLAPVMGRAGYPMLLIRIAGLVGLIAWRVARVWIGVLGLAQLLGLPWAVIAIAALVLTDATIPVRLCAAVGAVMVWHWPVAAAVIFAAPRLVLVLPGVISTWLADRRHPRPVWRGFDAPRLPGRGPDPLRQAS
jgi:hypothetical protein